MKSSCLSVFLLCSVSASAEVYDLGALHWRNIGPNRGGRSLAAAGSARRPLEYYFGATGGGLWKTTDGGTTWQPVTDGQIHSSSVGAVAVSESNPNVVYIGMGETQLRGSIMQGDGVYRSTDSGKTWKHIGLADTQAISRIRIHPTNPDLVYVAAFGHPFGENQERGVFRSKDGGATWQKILYRGPKAGAVDLAMDPGNPQVLFAATWEAWRTPWMLSSGGPASGLFQSTDGGDTWTEITRNPGLPRGIVGKIGVTVSPADSKRIYALVEADDGGMFRSDDGGATWTKVNEDRKLRQRAFYFSRIVADPKNRDTLYVGNVELYRSTDAGKTYSAMKAAHADHHNLWIAPDDPKRMIEANDGGASVTVNGGLTWTAQQYPTAQIYHVAITKDDPFQACGAQQDNSSICVPGDGGLDMKDLSGAPGNHFYSVARAEAGYIATHPVDPNIFYSGDQAGMILRYDRRTGETRNVAVYPLFFSGMPAKDLPDRWQWTFPIVFSPVDPGVLYTSSQHLWRTSNEGQSWERISPDLTRADPSTLGDSGGPITKDQNGPEIYGTIFTIAPSRFDKNTIWTGSDDGLIQITRDGGKTWRNVTPPSMPKFGRVSLIEASPHKAGTAYAAIKRYQMDDLQPYIFRSDDYGQNWTKIVNGIPTADFVHAVREDIKRPGLLYAGTEHGVYASFDNGASWQSIAANLPETQVPDLAVTENDLVIATHGRSFYVLDDVAVLRQMTPEIQSLQVYLMAPGDAVRPKGRATVDYYLGQDGDVKIEILDAGGKVVRAFSSKDGKGAPAGKRGTNRFVWDLRYPGAIVFEGMVMRGADPSRGPFAAPGNYTVRLTARGQTISRPLLVRRDPKLISASDAELQAQFRLAIEARDKTSEANKMVIAIRELNKEIRERAAAAKNPDVSAAAEGIETKLSRVEEDCTKCATAARATR